MPSFALHQEPAALGSQMPNGAPLVASHPSTSPASVPCLQATQSQQEQPGGPGNLLPTLRPRQAHLTGPSLPPSGHPGVVGGCPKGATR